MASISDCPITKSDAGIVKSWIVDKNSFAYKVNESYHTGIDLRCKTVYSVCYGVVIELGRNDTGHYHVTVQYDKDRCVRYMHLKSESVTLGGVIPIGAEIGIADSYVHFEYLTRSEGEPSLPVRISNVTYYRHDPTAIAKNGIEGSAGSELYTAYQAAVVGRVNIDYTKIDKYMITVDRNTPKNIDYTKLKDIGVIGVLIEAGYLYDSYHKRCNFRSPSMINQVAAAQSAGLSFGFYVDARATNLEEANNELAEIQFCIRHYPPMLGLWVRPYLTLNIPTNTKILQRYQSVLTDWGLKGKIGLYATRSQLSSVNWGCLYKDWYLWLVDPVSDLTTFTNSLLSPDQFKVKESE